MWHTKGRIITENCIIIGRFTFWYSFIVRDNNDSGNSTEKKRNFGVSLRIHLSYASRSFTTAPYRIASYRKASQHHWRTLTIFNIEFYIETFREIGEPNDFNEWATDEWTRVYQCCSAKREYPSILDLLFVTTARHSTHTHTHIGAHTHTLTYTCTYTFVRSSSLWLASSEHNKPNVALNFNF